MPEPTPVTLNHFALVRFTDEYWRLDPEARRRARHEWLCGVREAAEAVHLYQVFGLEAGHDLLVWSARRAEDPAGEGPGIVEAFFARWAAAASPVRSLLKVRETLWGFTRPSQYTKTRSRQELDPFSPGRQSHLIVYPFVKTAEWYLTDREARQRMMAAHIKVGKQYEDITQLLLYSFGLQDQEFVVVYETKSLLRFLNLVEELRATEARRFTQRDQPLHAGLWQRDPEELGRWL
jgi:chlorite dismutase